MGLLGPISGYRLDVHLKKELIDIIGNSLLPVKRSCRILGLKLKRFYRWRKNYTLFGVDGLVDEKPIAKMVPNKLLREEEEAILNYARLHPKERHREIQFNLDRGGLATASFSSVYRRLKKKGLIKEHHLKISKHKKGRPTATYAHEIWLVDITYVPVGNGFWYLIAVIDLYSRYIVGWDLSATMTSRDVQKVIDFALLQYGFYEKKDKPKIHSDNGSQMKAKSFKAFLRDLGVLNEYSRPHVPEDQAVLERFFRTIKQGEVYHQEYENHYQARDGISEFINYYNHRRPHQGIGFITPYEKLTGQEERILKERKAKVIVAQEMRKIENRRKMNTDTFEEMTPVKNRNKKIFI
ncbi:MAG: IS3 family transposase [Candidatus Aerophobetes bacterium]|nr:IS3 family transposase [Candidatus Aerophobetes bacterium]